MGKQHYITQIQCFTDLKRQMEEIREKVMGFFQMKDGGDGET